MRALAAVIALACIILAAVVISEIGAFLMKRIAILAAVAASAIALSGCAGMSPFAIDTKASPAAQQVQAEAKAAIDKQFMTRLDHCTLTGQWSMGAGGLAGTSTGASFGGGVSCLAEPWPGAAPASSPTP